MYLDASFFHFDESVGTLYCTLPWSGQKSRLHSWAAGCQFEIMDKNGWRNAPDEADLPILSTDFIGDEKDHPFSLYAQSLPEPVAAGVSRYGTDRQAMLQVCAASERGIQLLRDDPNLLWFIAPFLARASNGDRASIHSLLGYKRKFLLIEACGSEGAAIAKLLRVLPAPGDSGDYRGTLLQVATDENYCSAFRHKKDPDWALLFLALRHRGLFRYPAVRRLFLEKMPIKELRQILNNASMIYRDTARAGRALNITGTQAMVEACNSWASLINLHNRWTERLNIRNRAFKTHGADREFPAPPFSGTNTIQPIQTVQELRQEGMTMRHCVGGYAEAVCSGGTYIYRILEPERATLEIRLGSSGIWTVAQIKSFANKVVEHQTRNIVLSWLREVQR